MKRLNTEDYKSQIFELHKKGLTGKEISRRLNFKNHQPIYNFFKKYNLKNNKIYYKRKYTLKENFFNCIDTEEKSYILGFICADGNVETNRIKITLSIKDLHILEDIKKSLKSNQKITFFKRKNPYTKGKEFCEMCNLTLNSVKLVKPLLKMNLHKDKTYSLNSSVLNFVPKHLVRHFLRGYFDGDGNVIWNKKYSSGVKCSINICGNKEFLENTFQLFFPVNNKMYFFKKTKQTWLWRVSSKEKVKNFLDYIYKNSKIHLKRKYKIYLESKYAHLKPL